MMPLLFRRSGGGASSATEVGVAVAVGALFSAAPAFKPLLLPPLLVVVLLLVVLLLLPLLLLPPAASWEPLPRLDMVGPRPRPRCPGSLPTAGVHR